MDELDDPYALSLISLVLMISLNIVFNDDVVNSYKTYFLRRVRSSVSGIMYELGKKSRNYYRMRDSSFWKLHDRLKDEIDRKSSNISRRTRKKRKKARFVPNGITYSSLRLST